MDYKLRKSRIKNIPKSLWNQCLTIHEDGVMREFITAPQDSLNSYAVLAIKDKEVLGWAVNCAEILTRNQQNYYNYSNFVGVCVKPEYRRQGIGTAITIKYIQKEECIYYWNDPGWDDPGVPGLFYKSLEQIDSFRKIGKPHFK